MMKIFSSIKRRSFPLRYMEKHFKIDQVKLMEDSLKKMK